MKKINRKKFLQEFGLIGAATAMAPSVLARPFSANIGGQGKKARLAITGCGSVSNSYLPILAAAPHVELVSCCDILPERAKMQSEKFNIPNHYPGLDEMLKGPKFDLMLTLADMQVHGELNRKALNNGVNVWSEKPLANTYKEGVELVALAKERGLRIWGAPVVVESPQFAFMSKSIQEGKLGKVAAAHANYGHEGPDWSSFFYEKLGGSMPDLAVYNMTTITGLLGPAISVVAMLNIITPTRKIHEKGEITVEEEDNAMVLLEHASGALSHIQSGFNYYNPHGHSGEGETKATVSIVGNRGNIHMIGYDWDPVSVELTSKKEDNPYEYTTGIFANDKGNYEWPMGASLVANTLLTGKEPLLTVEHSLHVLEIIEAARKSQETGSRIPLKSSFTWPVVS
jgi:predicted dehydrogenase